MGLGVYRMKKLSRPTSCLWYLGSAVRRVHSVALSKQLSDAPDGFFTPLTASAERCPHA